MVVEEAPVFIYPLVFFACVWSYPNIAKTLVLQALTQQGVAMLLYLRDGSI